MLDYVTYFLKTRVMNFEAVFEDFINRVPKGKQ